MLRNSCGMFCCALAAVFAFSSCGNADEWSWRGPYGNGHALASQQVPTQWSTNQNIAWVTNLPGRGHSSPVVFNNQIFLTTADEQQSTQSVLCFDLATGASVWDTTCHEGVAFPTIHPKNTQASPSIAIGDRHVFAVFCNQDKVHVTCLSLDGQVVWQEAVGEWIPTRYQFGFGQSPIFHDGKLIVTSESETDPFVMALQPKTGRQIWKIKRPTATSYGTPVVADVGGRSQLLISGGRNVAGYDPQSGNELWTTDASWRVACGTMIWHPTKPIVYASGGYPSKQTLAVKADGTGRVLWQNKIKCYEQSLILVDGCVYGHAEGGILYCWDALDGTELWRERLGGAESASPVFAAGKIYFTNESGTTWVIRPSRSKFDLLATNQLEEESFASMAIVDNSILMRVADRAGERRQERLYRIR